MDMDISNHNILFIGGIEGTWIKDKHEEGLLCPESSATGMGQFPICKLKGGLLKSSVTACTIDKNAFSAPFGISYMRTEI